MKTSDELEIYPAGSDSDSWAGATLAHRQERGENTLTGERKGGLGQLGRAVERTAGE